MPRHTTWRPNLLTAAAATLATLLLAEAGLRLASPVGLAGARRRVLQTLPGVKREILVETNAFGFRSLTLRELDKGPRTLRVLCLGASTTDAPFQSTEDAWHGLLQARLSGRFEPRGVRVEVVARGWGGSTVFDHLAWAERNLHALAPDVVVTLEGINDLCWRGGQGYAYDRSQRLRARRAEAALPLGGWDGLASRHSQVYRRLRLLGQSLALRRELAAGRARAWLEDEMVSMRQEYRRLAFEDAPVRRPDPFVEFEDGLGLLLDLLRRRGIETVVLGQPALWKPDLGAAEQQALWFQVYTPRGPVRAGSGWLSREMARYNGAQRAQAERVGARYVALEDAVPRDLRHFLDDCHYTDAGNQVVAETALPAVAEAVEAALHRRGLQPGARAIP